MVRCRLGICWELTRSEQDRWSDKPWVAKTGKMNIESRLEGAEPARGIGRGYASEKADFVVTHFHLGTDPVVPRLETLNCYAVLAERYRVCY